MSTAITITADEAAVIRWCIQNELDDWSNTWSKESVAAMQSLLWKVRDVEVEA